MEQGVHGTPSLNTVDKLAFALGVTTPSLLGEEPEPRISEKSSVEGVLAGNLLFGRTWLGLSQEALCSLSGVSRDQIARIEAQIRSPSIDTLARLSVALGVSAGQLLSPRRMADWRKLGK